MMGQLASVTDYNPESDFPDTFARRFPEGEPPPDPSQLAAQRLTAPYRRAQERAGTSPLGPFAESLAPKEPYEYGLMMATGGGSLLGRAIGAIPPLYRAGLAGAGFTLQPSETKADASKALGNLFKGAVDIAPKAKAVTTAENWLPVTPKPFVGDEAQRVFSPGIYKNPKVIAAEGAANVAPEHPALKALFGVTREDLWEIGKRGTRQGNVEPSYKMPAKVGGSYVSDALMNDANARRIIDTLSEAQKYPQLIHGMDAWYVMDPAFQRMVQLVGKEQAIKDYQRFNTVVPMFSPSSDVLTEINRGTAANMMIQRGEWPKFERHGGTAAEDRGPRYPKALRDVIGHAYHSTAQAPAVSNYLERGVVEMGQPKVPLYMQASGVPETGFQTRLPVPDAHWARGVGAADVRTTAKPGMSMRGREYHEIGPWYRENVAKPLGIEAVPAQGRQWGVMAPQTGVETTVGAPKLELLSQAIWDRAAKLGIDPKVLRDKVLMGGEHAALLLGIGGVGAGAMKMGGIAEGALEQ